MTEDQDLMAKISQLAGTRYEMSLHNSKLLTLSRPD